MIAKERVVCHLPQSSFHFLSEHQLLTTPRPRAPEPQSLSLHRTFPFSLFCNWSLSAQDSLLEGKRSEQNKLIFVGVTSRVRRSFCKTLKRWWCIWIFKSMWFLSSFDVFDRKVSRFEEEQPVCTNKIELELFTYLFRFLEALKMKISLLLSCTAFSFRQTPLDGGCEWLFIYILLC